MDNDFNSLPQTWEVVSLGDFVESEKGKKPKNQNVEESSEYCYPYVDIEAFEDGIIKSYTDGKNCRLCYENDFLMVWDGSRSGLVGKGMMGALGSTLVRINFPHISNSYAYYFLSSKYLQINSRAKGSGTPHVDPDLLWNYQFPIPPTNEQHRIVAKIEELFSELDKGIESLKTAREQLKVYRQSLLKHAFEGKLTEQWRAAQGSASVARGQESEATKDNAHKLESADDLLARIQKERENRYQQQLDDWKVVVKQWEVEGKEGKKPSRPKKLTKFQMLSDKEISFLPKLPKGWIWSFLHNTTERIQIGPFGSLLHKEDYVQDQVPLVNPSHIKAMKIIPDYNLTVLPKKLRTLEGYLMKQGDIVIGRRGEMGRCAVVTEKEDGWLCGTGSLFVRFIPSLKSEFYCHILSSRRVKDYLSDSSIGTTMQNLNQKILQTIPIPVCSKYEQIEIINEIKKQFSVVENNLVEIDNNIFRTESLRQSILNKAFSGQLVPQDPNDEPASELLERIKAEKAEQDKQNKARKTTKKTLKA